MNLISFFSVIPQVSSGESSHCILEGPPGLGKRTLALALLREDLGTAEIEVSSKFQFHAIVVFFSLFQLFSFFLLSFFFACSLDLLMVI